MPEVKQLEPRFRRPSKHKIRKHLTMDAMISTVRKSFEAIPEHRKREDKISLPDVLMSGFAIFSLKYPSLLAFDEQRNNS